MRRLGRIDLEDCGIYLCFFIFYSNVYGVVFVFVFFWLFGYLAIFRFRLVLLRYVDITDGDDLWYPSYTINN